MHWSASYSLNLPVTFLPQGLSSSSTCDNISQSLNTDSPFSWFRSQLKYHPTKALPELLPSPSESSPYFSVHQLTLWWIWQLIGLLFNYLLSPSQTHLCKLPQNRSLCPQIQNSIWLRGTQKVLKEQMNGWMNSLKTTYSLKRSVFWSQSPLSWSPGHLSAKCPGHLL